MRTIIMKFGIYSIFDSAVNAYLPPFFMVTDQSAARTFALCCRDPDHAFCRSPECFRLFRIGTFDDEKGMLIDGPRSMLLDAMVAKQMGASSVDAVVNFNEE